MKNCASTPITRRTFMAASAAAVGSLSFGGRAASQDRASFPEPRFIRTNGIRMAVYEQGDGLPVVFCHGFPQLAYSWRQQIPAFAQAGYRAIAPDMRGYGLTDQPKDVSAYDIAHLTDDMAGLLDAQEIERAVFCGHDWGAQVMWHMPIFHPDRTLGVISVNSSFSMRTRSAPIQLMRSLRGEDDYMVQFQEREVPEAALSKDVAKSIRVFSQDYSAETFGETPDGSAPWKFEPLQFLRDSEIPGKTLLSEDELAVFVAAYEKTGFSGGLNWYRNIDQNWKLTETVDRTINVPVLYVGRRTGINIRGRKAAETIPDLENHTLDNWGHWSLKNRSDEFNRTAIDWLGRRINTGN